LNLRAVSSKLSLPKKRFFLSRIINDFSLTIATVNGSGSQSANNILMRTLFRMGVPVSGKNLFPSNIAGLPTWFSIRVNEKGYVGRKAFNDVVIAMNKETIVEDLKLLKKGGIFIYNSKLKFEETLVPPSITSIAIDFDELCKEVTTSIQLKKLLINMIYVGVLSELLEIPEDVLGSTIEHQFKGKESVYSINKKAVHVGREFAQKSIDKKIWKYKVEKRSLNDNKILIDGNTSAALGMVYGGCSFAAWYPITPSSSLAEAFADYCHELRTDKDGKKRFAIVQSEDELSAISMVAGAGWAGSRAMTATSGPGISLMAETIGLMYFAEIPGVIWDVQRMGPSTGLPTRTSQGDILSAAHCSHGDTNHPIFFPSTPKECFEFAGMALDFAEKAQTPVFVLSDLDLGMNFWMSERFDYPEKAFDRGKLLSKEDLDKLDNFARYADVDGDGIPYRTLPGTHHDKAAYFTRGTGHTPEAKYSESSENYQELMNRLTRKWNTLKTMVPAPEITMDDNADVGLIYFGSTQLIIDELLNNFPKSKVNLCRLKSYPFHEDVDQFIKKQKKIIVLEQNQQGQMTELLRTYYPKAAASIIALTNCDGLPLCAEVLAAEFEKGGHFVTQ
jgi:2-oxoglutarate/2-oxoacid ferredoxin oxidoreductase subunit alpha